MKKSSLRFTVHIFFSKCVGSNLWVNDLAKEVICRPYFKRYKNKCKRKRR